MGKAWIRRTLRRTTRKIPKAEGAKKTEKTGTGDREANGRKSLRLTEATGSRWKVSWSWPMEGLDSQIPQFPHQRQGYICSAGSDKEIQPQDGDKVRGICRHPNDGDKFGALLYVVTVNGDEPGKAITRPDFDSLPLYPQREIQTGGRPGAFPQAHRSGGAYRERPERPHRRAA